MKSLIVILFSLIMATTAVASGDYVIGEGDGLDVAVWGVRDLSFSVRVRPDGKITVPGLGDVVASGYTPKELQGQLAVKLKDLVKNPIVTVTVREITNSKVYIFGGGIKSGVYDLIRRTTLLQLLCTIEDVRKADLQRAYVLRDSKKIKENFYNLFIQGDISEDITIEPHDSIFIPLLNDKSVYVLGAVNAPKAIEYRDGMSVMEAILEAGGFTKFADMNDTIVKRKDGDKQTTISIKAKDLIRKGDLNQNVKLKPGDYVIVSESIF